jgi:phage terminase large subunit
MSEQSIANYKRYEQNKPEHFWNMIKGYVPEVVRGKIYKNWKEIDELPHEARLERVWLDFGYSNDPTAIGGIYKYNGGYILDEWCYQTGMVNREISDTLKNRERGLTIADSSEPKSIEEIRQYGINVIGTDKGKDSIKQGIQYVQGQKISYTKRSVNIKKEYENYAWKEDKEGNGLNVPIDMYNHHMDGIRYAFSSLKPNQDDVEVKLQEQFNRNTYKQVYNSTR